MSVVDARQALAAMLAAVPGVAEAVAYPADTVGPTPLAYLGDGICAVTQGMSDEVETWTLPLTVIVARQAVYGQELQATETLLADLKTALRSHVTLGGAAQAVRLTEIREGQIVIGGVPFVGMTLTLALKLPKESVSYSG